MARPESTSTAPMRSDIEIDPGLLDNTSQNLPLAAPDTENAPPTPEVTPICLQKVPQLLPFASTKTANELAAQYAAESANSRSQGLDPPPNLATMPGNPPQMPASPLLDPRPTSESTPAPKKQGRKSAASMAEAIKEKPATCSQTKQVEQGNREGPSEASGAPTWSDGGQKMPTCLRVKGKGF
ncbi:hypothetical protein FRC11_007711 [Ceratobasidium sp. 423]|nr:hypothetical protein FRC11_007711 [Ceratobasidium sp. 423]